MTTKKAPAKSIPEFDWQAYEAKCKVTRAQTVSKQELLQAFQSSINADPEWNGKMPEVTASGARLLYNHLMLVIGNFLIDDERSVKLDDIGVLSLKFRKSRTGVAPYSFVGEASEKAPIKYVSRPKRVMSLRRPFYFELDEQGNPIDPLAESTATVTD